MRAARTAELTNARRLVNEAETACKDADARARWRMPTPQWNS